jgi:hypothetical protein
MPKAPSIQEKTDKLDLTKSKTFCFVKTHVKRMKKTKPQTGRKYLQKMTSI